MAWEARSSEGYALLGQGRTGDGGAEIAEEAAAVTPMTVTWRELMPGTRCARGTSGITAGSGITADSLSLRRSWCLGLVVAGELDDRGRRVAGAAFVPGLYRVDESGVQAGMLLGADGIPGQALR